MRNRRLGRKLGVRTKHRKAMLRNMATEFFRHERIRTTDVKAKELKRVADKIVTLAKNSAKETAANGGLSFKRRIFGYITDKEVARKVFTEIAKRYKQRPGGYSRIISLGFRKGDQTPISQIELITEEYKHSSRTKTPRKSNLPAPPPPKKEENPEEKDLEAGSASGKESGKTEPPQGEGEKAEKAQAESRRNESSGTTEKISATEDGGTDSGKEQKPADTEPEKHGGEG